MVGLIFSHFRVLGEGLVARVCHMSNLIEEELSLPESPNCFAETE